MSTEQTPDQDWDAGLYDARHSFVYKLSADLLELLAPRPAERILDVGCGTGQLTAQIAATGATVLGIDPSVEMIDTARHAFPDIAFSVADVRQFQTTEPFDAVFSNAALHWVPDAEQAVEAMAAALKPGGRLVVEFGGFGNVARIVAAVAQATGKSPAEVNPWYFPKIGEYATLLERHGLETSWARLIDRPTPLEEGDHGLRNWLEMFGRPCFARAGVVPDEQLLAAIETQLRPTLWQNGQWVADYRRIRIMASKT